MSSATQTPIGMPTPYSGRRQGKSHLINMRRMARDKQRWDREQALRPTMHERVRYLFGLDAQFDFMRPQLMALAQGALNEFTQEYGVKIAIQARMARRDIR